LPSGGVCESARLIVLRSRPSSIDKPEIENTFAVIAITSPYMVVEPDSFFSKYAQTMPPRGTCEDFHPTKDPTAVGRLFFR
jgi:hypothetical protein